MKRIAIIGAGAIASSVHIPSLKDIELAEVCAVCDLNTDRAKAGAAQFKSAKWYENYHTMLEQEKPDGVFVLVQPDQSYRIALDAMRAGADVFCEKPAGITMFQLESLARAQKENNVLLQIGFNRRYIPLVKKVREVFSSLSPLNQVNGCFFKNGDASFYDGCASALECDVIHVADLLCSFAQCDVSDATAFGGRSMSPVDNIWNSVFQFQNGMLGTIQSNYQTGGRTHAFELHCPDASAYIDLGFGSASCEADILFFGGQKSHSLASTGIQAEHFEHLDGREIAQSDEYYRFYGYYDEDLAFIKSMETRIPSEATIEDTIRAMKLIDMIRQSCDSRHGN